MVFYRLYHGILENLMFRIHKKIIRQTMQD